MLKACLNGARGRGQHPAVPVTPDQLAADARAAATAGAFAVHVHPRDAGGVESLDDGAIGAAVEAIRAAVPGLPVGVSTGSWIEGDPVRMLGLVRSWTVLPDFASVNLSQLGAAELMRTLLDAGVGVEAGLWTPADAETLIGSGLAGECLRVLVEPMEPTVPQALAGARAIMATLDAHQVTAPRLLHGMADTAWPVLEAAAGQGLDARIGLEDTLRMPDGSTAKGNAALVGAASSILSRASR